MHEARGEVLLTRADRAAWEDKDAHGRADEERGPAAERQPHAEQRAAAPPNSLAALGSDYSEDAAPERDEHAAAPTDDAGAKRQRLSGESHLRVVIARTGPYTYLSPQG